MRILPATNALGLAWHGEVVLELAGIAEVAAQIGHNVTMSELEFFQIFYEILMQCTGILVCAPVTTRARAAALLQF